MAAHDHDDNETSHLSEMELRVRAIETILVEKGYIETAALDRIVELYETKIGPHIGAQVIAKAWSDPAFRQALFEDASKAISALTQVGRVGDHLIAIENTPQLHNIVVCTLCSCYPTDVLGLPPTWYKSFAYRSRAVKEPRAVLADFGKVEPEPNEPAFHHRWEGRVLAMSRAIGVFRAWTIDTSRYAIELLSPSVYLASSYYERWFLRNVRLLTERGLIDADEIEAGRALRPGKSLNRG